MSDISAFGITATLPTGWDGRIGRRTDPVGPGSFRLRGPLVVPANDVLSTLHIAPR